MSIVTLANLLSELGDGEGPIRAMAPTTGRETSRDASGLDGETWVDPGTGDGRAVEEAYERGVSDGQREAEARLAHEIGEARAAGERKLELARAGWAEDEGRRMAEHLLHAVQEMHAYLANQIAAVLLPVVRDEFQREAVTKLAAAVRATEPGDWSGPVVVRAPADLVEGMRSQMSGMAALVQFEPTNGSEIEVVVDKTVLATQMGQWNDVVRRMLG